MAFATPDHTVQSGYKYTMTPSMLLVEAGSEFRTHDRKKLWNKNGTTTAAFKALLTHFADHLLQPGAKQDSLVI